MPTTWRREQPSLAIPRRGFHILRRKPGPPCPSDSPMVCADVPHRHLVLTIPRLSRGHFIGQPAALGELARDALTACLRDRTGRTNGPPGLVLVVWTFGDFLLWHPHVHVVTAVTTVWSKLSPDDAGQ